MNEKMWYRAPGEMFEGKKAFRFFPTASMSVQSQLNAIMRFFLYYSVIMVAITRNLRHLLIAVLGAVLTAVVSEVAYKKRDEEFDSDEPVGRRACVEPTVDNPHMNFTAFDARDRPPACAPWNVADQITQASGEALQDSPFQKPFDRFYTMPCTTSTNDQHGFAKWLYGDMPGKADESTPR